MTSPSAAGVYQKRLVFLKKTNEGRRRSLPKKAGIIGLASASLAFGV